MYVLVAILVAIVVILLICNMSISKKIQDFDNLKRHANNLKVVQDFLSSISE